MLSVDENWERDFTFLRNPGADIMLSSDELPEEMIKNSKILHFGSVSLTDEPERSATLRAAEIARAAGVTVSYDPNYRAALWDNEERALQEMKAALPLADIVKVSDEELQLLTGTSHLELGSKALAEAGPWLVLVTLGADGVFYRMGGNTGHVPGRRVTVADTNGAGDTFFGAVLTKLTGLSDMRAMAVQQLEVILRFANAAASITTSRSGAIPAMPTLAETLAALD